MKAVKEGRFTMTKKPLSEKELKTQVEAFLRKPENSLSFSDTEIDDFADKIESKAKAEKPRRGEGLTKK